MKLFTARAGICITSFALVSMVSAGDWDTFVYPTVVFEDKATSLEGSQILQTAVPDIEAMMRDASLEICKKLFTNQNDDKENFTKLNLWLEDDATGVAAKWGSPPEIWIGVSAQYLANFFHNNNDDYEMVRKEVQGMLAHEGTHGYQYSPKNCGSYDGSSEFFAFVEGMADYVRGVTYNYSPPRYPSEGGDWHDGYNTGGFFIQWLVEHKKSTFAIEFNHLAGSMNTFSWDEACRTITGQGVDDLWNEYQQSFSSSIASSGTVPAQKSLSVISGRNPCITYTLVNPGDVSVSIYSLRGALVQTLVSPGTAKGTHEVVWNGRDVSGKALAAGRYYFQLTAPGVSQSSHFTLMR